jgi:hypothetical protein
MATYTDKDVIHHWLRLHNRLKSETYQVESWPDDDSSKRMSMPCAVMRRAGRSRSSTRWLNRIPAIKRTPLAF